MGTGVLIGPSMRQRWSKLLWVLLAMLLLARRVTKCVLKDTLLTQLSSEMLHDTTPN